MTETRIETMAAIPIAPSVTPRDESTSIVVEATGPQVELGKVEVETQSDVVYSKPLTTGHGTVALELDVLRPRTAGRKPLVIWFPGGGFIRADKCRLLKQRTYVAEAGYVVASVEYRTILVDATYVQAVADAKSAIRYLRAHAGRFGIDPGRVAVWGESVGGYLAAMVGTTDGVEEFDVGDYLDQGSDVQAVIDQFGPSDLAKLGADFDEAFRKKIAAPGAPSPNGCSAPEPKGRSTTTRRRSRAPIQLRTSIPPILRSRSFTAPRTRSSHEARLCSCTRRYVPRTSTARCVIAAARHGDMSFLGDTDAVVPWSTQTVMNLLVSFLDKQLRVSA